MLLQPVVGTTDKSPDKISARPAFIDPKILFRCSCWDGSSALISPADYGSYARYEITGAVPCWCVAGSSLTFAFDTNFASWCCAHGTCGSYNAKSADAATGVPATGYSCAGQLPNAFGGSANGFTVANSTIGWAFKIKLTPISTGAYVPLAGAGCAACPASACFAQTGAFYEIETSLNGALYPGIRNNGCLQTCCCADTRCLRGVCFTNDAGSSLLTNPTATPMARSTITITGFGRLV